MSNLLLTCDLIHHDPVILLYPGFSHPTTFGFYIEADHEAVGFVLQALNLDTMEKLESGVMAPTSDRQADWVASTIELPEGRWLLSSETVSRGIVAQRKVELRNEETEED